MTAPAELAAAARAEVVARMSRLSGRDERGIVVDSPPGAGKSELVVRVARELAGAGEPVMVVAQTNGQVDDLTDRLAEAAPGLRIGRLSGQDYVPGPRITRHAAAVVAAQRVREVLGCPVVVATAAKWATVSEGLWRWAIIDEAYQMRSDTLLRIASRFVRGLFVGDPGQLDPFSTVEIDRWTGLAWDPMLSAVAVLLRNNPQVPVLRLPVSWRLPVSAVPVVAEAFYPFTGFVAGTGAAERRVAFSVPALRAGIAIGVAHRDQAQAVRDRLGALASGGVVVDTANRLQGREFDLVVVLHPPSGRRDATAFHLEAGRLCVLCSRHRHGCVVVARAGIAELLDAHPCSEPVHLGVPAKFPDGWAANQTVLAHLASHRVRAT